MWTVKIDSRVMSTPTEVFTLVVTYGRARATLIKVLQCGGLSDWVWSNTDVNDDLPRSFCDGVDGPLRGGV